MKFDSLTCQFWVIVFLAEVTKPHITQSFVEVLGKCLGCLVVTEMSGTAGNAVLQYLRVLAVAQHLLIVIGFDDEVVGLEYVFLHLFGRRTHIGHDAECAVAHLDAVPHVLGRVMRYRERGDGEWANREWLVRHDVMAVDVFNFLDGMHVATDAFVDRFGGVDRQVEFLTDIARSLDMVGMVMGDDECLD